MQLQATEACYRLSKDNLLNFLPLATVTAPFPTAQNSHLTPSAHHYVAINPWTCPGSSLDSEFLPPKREGLLLIFEKMCLPQGVYHAISMSSSSL
jgi:hypothetical protein